MQRAGHWVWDDFVETTGDAVAVAVDEAPDAPLVEEDTNLHDDLDLLLALFGDEEPDGASANNATPDVMVAPPVPAEAHPHEDFGTPTPFVDDQELDVAIATDATPDVMVAPSVPAEAHPHEDAGAPPVPLEAHPHEDLDPPAPFVDEEEPAAATANDATPDEMVALPVDAEEHLHEDFDAPTPFVDDEEPDVATATDATSDEMVAPPVQAEEHPHEDLDALTAFVDDEEPDGAAANDALRFTLPMGGGSAEQTLLVLVPSKTGLVYAHQYGGQQCRYAEIEGFLVPAWVNREARAALDRLFLADLGGNGVRDEVRSEAVKKVRDTIEQIWYRGTGDRMAPLQVDDARVDELDEAWVPVLTPDGPAYLAWSNSD